jgi:RNA polymerase sigma-70 factor (ECF subfamily)
MTAATLPALRFSDRGLDARLRAVVNAHYDALWRFLRRIGVEESWIDDAVQQVLLVFAQRASGVEAEAARRVALREGTQGAAGRGAVRS